MSLPSPFVADRGHIGVALGGAYALFTTRRGGASAGPYASLNLGLLTEDDAVATAANRRHLRELVSGDPAWGLQVHGAHIELRTAGGGPGADADGQATATPGVAPMVVTADCLGIVLASADAVAVVHAGWRGLAAGVIAHGVQALRSLSVETGTLSAAIGPGAGVCCYEVGEEVHAVFAAYGDAVRRQRKLDLKAIAAAQLAAAGVAELHDVGLCTMCEPELFYSHRRDHGVTGRQAAIAWLGGA